ncbi:MAG: undecaprenyldiphospho-muramoylpentapeptide beta-N-acetylglucosaminyltransferase [Elusimicrobia bacterium]|nr:undecaprenyldiphospho-muramoylpentapeptide beta-N-acetylglucosaminyltransferase [Candidatus Obscuribacterium magneticum]
MKVLIAAGGTGGHFYPGLSAGKSLRDRGAEILFVVRKKDFVIPLLQKEKIPFATISAGGFVRRFRCGNMFSLAKLAWGWGESLVLLARYKPDWVLAMGGYLSVPPALAARLFRIPVLLHEQNITPGLANRLLDRLATKVALSFEESRKYFRSPVSVTGNPVRPEFKALPDRGAVCSQWGLDPQKMTMLVFGGSLGAHRLNELIVEAVTSLKDRKGSFQVVHFTGTKDAHSVREAYEKNGISSKVDAYCHDMPAAYSVADFVVCRSGASTVAELIVVQKPAVLVPYPLATEAHQLTNAKLLSEAGAAEVVEEKGLDGARLASYLRRFLDDKNGLLKRRQQYGRFQIDPLAAGDKIADLLMPR